MIRRSVLILFSCFFGTVANAVPGSLTYQGRIKNTDGQALEYNGVKFEFSITNPTGTCTIYRETSLAIDMRNSGGVFDVPIGTGSKVYPSNTTFKLLDSFDNGTTFTCESGLTYTPSADDKRVLRVQFFDGIGWRLVTPDNEIRAVPYAGHAKVAQTAHMLGNNIASDFVLKSNVPLCGADQYLRHIAPLGTFECTAPTVTGNNVTGNITGSAAGFTGNLSGDVSGTQSTTSVGKIKGIALDMTGIAPGKVLKYNGTSWSPADDEGTTGALTGLTGDVTSTGSPTATVTLNNNTVSTNKIVDGAVTSAKIADGTIIDADISGSANIADTKLATITTAGKVSGGAITSGTIGGSTTINTSGNVTASGVSSSTVSTNTLQLYKTGNGNKVTITVPTSLSPDYSLQLPGDAGGPGQILSTNGSGVLSWISPSAGTVTSVTATPPLASTGGSTPVLSLSNSGVVTGDYTKVTVNAKGLVTAGSSLIAADIPNLNGDVSSTSGTSNTKVEKIQGVAVAATAPVTGQVLLYGGANWAPQYFGMGQLRSTVTGTTQVPASCSTADKTLTWSAITDSFVCTTISIANTQVTGLGTASTKNFGTAAGNLVELDGAGKIPTSLLPSTAGNILDGGNSTGATVSIGTNDANTLAFKTNSTTKMTVTSAGNVGIGTTTPQAKLDVNGTIRATSICDENGANCKTISGGWGPGGTVTSVATGTGLTGGPITGSGTISIAAGGVSATELASNAVTTVKIADGNVTGAKLETLAGLVASTYGSATAIPAVTVDTKGRITAITTNNITGLLPAASGANGKYLKSDGTSWSGQDVKFSDIKNSVGATAFNTSSCAANQTVKWSSLTDMFECQNIGSLDASAIATGTIDVNRLPPGASMWQDGGAGKIYYNGGNVGIGTATPGAPLTVQGEVRQNNNSAFYSFYDTAGSTRNGYLQITSTDASLVQQNAAPVRFFTSNTERVRIDSAGNVGIGTTSPQAKLDVNGTIRATSICDQTGANCKTISGGWGPGGTVTSVATGTGLTGGPITGSGTISIAAGGVSATELASNAVTTVKIADGNVTGAKLETLAGLVASTYGSATAIPAVTVDTKGRITAITTNNITGLLPTSSGVSGKYLKSDGTSWSGQDVKFSDIKNSVGATAFNTSSCAANQTVKWSSLTDMFECQNIGSLDAATITTGTINSSRLPAGASMWQDGGAGKIYYNSGNVGVGTASPGRALEVNGIVSSKQLTVETALVGNSGLGRGTAGTISNHSFSLLSNNTERLTVDTNGNIGIGTTNPNSALHINGATVGGAKIQGTTSALLRFKNTGAPSGSQVWDVRSDSANGDFYVSKVNDVESAATSQPFTIQASTGNVGIGTSSPSHPLQIYGGASGTGITSVRFGNADSGVGGGYLSSNSPNQSIISGGMEYSGGWIARSTTASSINMQNGGVLITTNDSLTSGSTFAPSARMIIMSNGNVGVGTSSPAKKLHVVGGNARFDDAVYLKNEMGTLSHDTVNMAITNNAGSTLLYNNVGASDSNLAFGFHATAGLGRVVSILNNGNVGIGTTSPVVKLHVMGPIMSDGDIFASTGKLRSNMPGTAGATNNVCFNGSGQLDSCVSLSKFKTEVQDLDVGLEFLMKLRPVTYRIKNSSTHEMGFIAEEINALDPRMSLYGTDGNLTGVKYDKITSLLTKSVQELKEQKDREIASLKEQLDQKSSELLLMKEYLCSKDANAPFCK